MELGLLPSQFLSVVLEESDRNGNKSTYMNDCISRSLSSSVTISPVVPKSFTLKKLNGKHSANLVKNSVSNVCNGTFSHNDYLDLKRRLPRTVLEECVVELADSSSKVCNKVPEPYHNAVIIKPMYAKKSDKLQPPSSEKEENIDFRDLFAKVEAVYSDDDEPITKPVATESHRVNGISQPADHNFSTDVVSVLGGYACDHCPNKYSNKGALWQHNVAAHSVEKSCECQLCGRKFYRNCSLALHMKCHSDEQNCSCKVCGKEFSRLSALERHVKCHNVEVASVSAATNSSKIVGVSAGSNVVNAAVTAAAAVAPLASTVSTTTTVTSATAAGFSTFVCKICNKSFGDEAMLRVHVFSHSEKFTCEQCNVTFNTKQLLDLHFHITHKRSETPFACKLCKARFANLRELNEHAASHTYEKVRISCHHCGEVFTQRCSYKKHIQLHVGERLSCTICRIDFTQRSSLLRHYKRLHLINDIPNPSASGVGTTPNLTIITK